MHLSHLMPLRTVHEALADNLPSPRRVVLGALTLTSRYCLAPLAGYTNLPFRLAIRPFGGLGLATTDLVNAKALLRGSQKTLELIQTCPEDHPLSIQIYGGNGSEMAAAAQWIQEHGASVVDINMGCPVNKVIRNGCGAAMMCQPDVTLEMVQKVVEAVRLPVTVKMRLGWDDRHLSAPFFAREFEQIGVAGVTIHGRTRAQGFHGAVNREGIRQVVEAVERIPVFGNGDLRTCEDVDGMMRETGCAGVAIGRGALLNPWIFAQLAEWETRGTVRPPATYEQRLDFMERHFHWLTRLRDERHACLTFRKAANWYCKALKPGRVLQQRLLMINRVAEFDELLGEWRERVRREGPPSGWQIQPAIAVPSGPNERW